VSATRTHQCRQDTRGYFDLDLNIESRETLPVPVRKVEPRVVNRYCDILPNPRTRVHLDQVNNDPISGYINANFVRGPDCNPRAYICAMVRPVPSTESRPTTNCTDCIALHCTAQPCWTGTDTPPLPLSEQGPLPDTVDAFWRMLWSKKPPVVVMITQLRECGREKCARYWPKGLNLDPVEYSPGIRVVATDAVVSTSGFVQTTLCVTKGKSSINIVSHCFYAHPFARAERGPCVCACGGRENHCGCARAIPYNHHHHVRAPCRSTFNLRRGQITACRIIQTAVWIW
jgi:protein tyrosine phosphatase